jgi:hypothetical protein
MVGNKVRKIIKEIGGVMPENLLPEQHIKEVKKNVKILDKESKKNREYLKNK